MRRVKNVYYQIFLQSKILIFCPICVEKSHVKIMIIRRIWSDLEYKYYQK